MEFIILFHRLSSLAIKEDTSMASFTALPNSNHSKGFITINKRALDAIQLTLHL